MKKPLFIFFTQLTICLICSAQTVVEDCPKPEADHFKMLCYEVENQAEETDESSPYTYRFHRRIEEMACVDRKTDTDSIIKRKVQSWWNKYKLDCNCNRANFVVPDGNILKYAATQKFEAFFVAVKPYELNYNFIDPADGKTLLDFTLAEYQRSLRISPNHPTTTTYKRIHDNLRKEGALYASELKEK